MGTKRNGEENFKMLSFPIKDIQAYKIIPSKTKNAESLEQVFKNIPSKHPVQKVLGGTPSKFLVQQITFLYSRKHTYI